MVRWAAFYGGPGRKSAFSEKRSKTIEQKIENSSSKETFFFERNLECRELRLDNFEKKIKNE